MKTDSSAQEIDYIDGGKAKKPLPGANFKFRVCCYHSAFQQRSPIYITLKVTEEHSSTAWNISMYPLSYSLNKDQIIRFHFMS